MRAFMVCVDYADLLAVTLPYNRHHFREVWVVTTGRDAATREVALENRARVFATDAFYEDGARFNKWRALEEALDYAGRLGWTCLMDADVLWPKDVGMREQYGMIKWYPVGRDGPTIYQDAGILVTPRRRMWMDWPHYPNARMPDPLTTEESWKQFPLHRNDAEFAGYSQIFHATDPALGSPPWHDVNWRTAGGADSFFQAKWHPSKKIRPPFECLHLGEAGVNWAGRVSPYADGTVPEGAEETRRLLREMIKKRGTEPSDRFFHEKLK